MPYIGGGIIPKKCTQFFRIEQAIIAHIQPIYTPYKEGYAYPGRGVYEGHTPQQGGVRALLLYMTL